MNKYSNLTDHLKFSKQDEITLTFSQIEEIIGDKLPASANKYRQWWANNASVNSRQCKAWLEVGYKTTDVQFGKSVTFVKE